MATPPLAAIILAAGKGTRMRSGLHKVLHEIGGRPMIGHVLAAVDALAPTRRVVVVGDRREQLEGRVGDAVLAVQEPQQGTGHAVLCAEAALDGFSGDVVILYGDVPLIPSDVIVRLRDALHGPGEPLAAVLGFRPADPAAYGRIKADSEGRIERMVEYKDASPEERAITLCNSGVMAVRSADLFALLKRVTNNNAAGEYYLPDIIEIARNDGRLSVVIETAEEDVAGVNSRVELAAVEAIFQSRARTAAMLAGATLVDPETVTFSVDTRLGRDVTVEPQVVFGPGVEIADGATIKAFSHLEKAQVGPGAVVGPYARLRPGTTLAEKAKIGNFVELKNAAIGPGAKVNHLSYVGDATVGADANIGAGTITCNYDGFLKYRTEIGAGAFIGSNSALVAPVTVGAGAIVGAGSVITGNVEADALAVARGEQQVKPGWAARFRDRMRARKKTG